VAWRLNWPALDSNKKGGIELKKLVIWDNGKIELQGGTVTLPKPISLKLGPAELSITALGFGSDERYKGGVLRKYNYFEFAAGLSVKPGGVDARGDGIKFYYSVDGVSPFDFFIRIESINIDLIIPGSASESEATLILKGYLSMKQAPPPDDGADEYIGGVAFSMPKTGLGGSVAMRMIPKVPSFVVDVEIDLPSPIIIFAGVGIYGFRGLFGQKYLASRTAAGLAADAGWYEYYKAKVSPDYKEGIQVSKFAHKEGFSIGLGASIATAGDGGKTFSSKVFLLLSLPDVLLVQGQAAILRERIKITDPNDPPFSLLIAITSDSFTSDFGVDYKIPESSGKILKVNAHMGMGFFLKNPNAWYINVGTQSSPVTGRILDLFDVYAYLMFSGTGIQAGAGASFAKSYKAGPLRADLQAYIDIAGKINYKPVQIGASLSLGGSVKLKVFGFGLNLSAVLTLAGEVPHPFFISGSLRACISFKIFKKKKEYCITIAFEWVFDRTPNTSEIPLFAGNKAIKARNVLTDETYPLFELPNQLLPAGLPGAFPTIDLDSIGNDTYTIPLDSYIDIEFLKPIAGDAGGDGISYIGGAQWVSNTDSVPQKRGKLTQVNHTFTLTKLTIKHWNGSSWQFFHVYDALSPLSIPGINVSKPSNPKYGFWQFDTATHKINRLSLLATSPLSYSRNMVKAIPSEYLGITSRDIFCAPASREKVCVGFNSGVGKKYKASKVSGQGDLMFRLIGADGSIQALNNPFGFTNGLLVPAGSSMEIYFSEPTSLVELTLLMRSQGLSVSYYKEAMGPEMDSNGAPVKSYVLLSTVNPSISNLMQPLSYDDINKPVDKVVIVAGQCAGSGNGTGGGGGGDDTTAYQQEVCSSVNGQISTLQNKIRTLTVEKNNAQEVCNAHTQGDCAPIGNLYCERATELENEISQLNSQIATLTAYSSANCSIPSGNTGGDGNNNGGNGSSNNTPCGAYLFKVCRMTQTDASFNASKPSSTQVSNAAAGMIDAINNSLQPIWRPDTIYGIEVETTDKLNVAGSYIRRNSYIFRTAGPVGHFHTKRKEFFKLSSEDKDRFRLKTLKDYIDYDKSYPNANGNILNAKPLFYGCPKLLIFFVTPQVYTMYSNFDAYNGLSAVTSSLQVIVKDPAEPDDQGTPITGPVKWVINDAGRITKDVQTLQNIMNGPKCVTVLDITHQKGANIEVELCGILKPLKLYNAVYNAIFKSVSNGVHTYSFQTSQYINFNEQVQSYIIKDDAGIVKKYAFFDIAHAFNPGVSGSAPTGIELAKTIIDANEPQLIVNAALRDFAQPFDRLITKAFEMTELNPAVTTEFNMLVDTSTGNTTSGNVLGILIRNPEPFNDPKLKGADLLQTIQVVTDSTGNTIDPHYKVIFSKDVSKAFITHTASPTDLNITASQLFIRFRYLEYDGTSYVLNSPATNQVVVGVDVKAPLTSLTAAYCGKTNVALDDVLQANLVTGAIGYEFKIEHAASGFSASYTRDNSDGILPLVEVAGLTYNKVYSVSVRPVISGRLTKFGSVCQVSTKVLSFVIVQSANIVQGQSGLIHVEVQDEVGNIIYDYQEDVTLVAGVSSHAVIANSGLVSIVNGIGSISITDDYVETVDLSFVDSQNTGIVVSNTSQVTFTVAPATMLVVENPVDTVEGMQAAVTVHARNSFPNQDIDTNYNGTVKLVLSGSATVINSGIVTIVNGTGTTQITDNAPETVILTLQDVAATGLNVSSTQDIIFALVPATQFLIADPADSIQGVAVTVTISARNQYGYIDTGYQNGVTLVTNGNATGVGLVNIVNGVGTIQINDTTAETVHLTLSDTQSTGLNVSSNQDVVFGIANATKFVILDPTDSVQGTATTITIQAQNQYNTIDTAYQNGVMLVSNGNATGAGLVNIVNGVGTIQINDTTAQTVHLTLSDTQSTGLNVSSNQDVVFGIAPATKFVIIDPADSIQGQATTVTVQAQNNFGTVDTAYQNDVTLVTNGNATGGGLVDIVNGVGTKSINDISAQTVHLTLSDTQTTGLNISSSQDVVFGIAPATKFVILDPADSVQGVATTVTVQAQNQYGTIDTAYQYDVMLVTSGSATGAGLVNIINGVGTIQINDTTPQTVHLTLSDTQSTGLNVSSNQDVVFGIAPASKFVVLDPADSIQGVATTVTVQAQNQYGTIDTAYQRDVTLVTNGNATGGGLVNIINGVGTIQINDTTPQTVHLTLSDTQGTGLNISSSQDVVFGIAPANAFILLDPADTVQGVATTVTVQAQNSFGTIDTAYQNDVTLVSNGSATGAGLVNIVNGIGTLQINDSIVETVHLSLSDTQSTGLNVSSNQDVVFGIAPATRFVIIDPADSIQGTATTVTVQAQNSFGIIDTAYQNHVTLVTNGNATGGGLVNIVNGVGTKSINDTTAQTVHLTLSDTLGTGLNVSSSQDVVYGIAPATKFVIIDPADSIQGTATTVTVQAQNQYGTIDTAYQRDVTLVTNGNATGGGLVDIVNGVGTKSINDTTAQTVHLTLSDTQSTGLNISSNQDVVFGIAAATKFVIIDPADTVQGVATTVTVQAQNQYGTIDTAYQYDVMLVTNGSATGAGLVNIINGVGTIQINDTTPQTVHLTLSDTQSTGLNVSSNQDVVFGIASATKFVIINPTDSTVGSNVTVTVQAQNQYGTIDTAYQRDVTLVAGGSATGGGLVDIVNGVGTKQITDAVAETVNLTLSDTQSTGLNVTSTQDVIFASVLIFSDTFTVGTFDNTLLNNHTPDLGTSWTQLINVNGSSGIKAYGITNGAAPVSAVGTFQGSFYGANVSGGYAVANYEVEVKSVITAIGLPITLGVRVSSNGNDGYFVRFYTGGSQLYKRVGGTWTAVGSAAGGVSNNATAKLQIIGTTLKFFINGTLTITATVTDISATGVAGLGMGRLMTATDSETGIQADNFKVTLV
jgi:hypothetical protein